MEENSKHNEITVLTDIPTGSSCIISKVHGHGGFRHRIMEMGFIKGEKVDVIKNAPLMDPIEYSIMGSHVSLRRSEADKIEVVALEEGFHPDFDFNGTIEAHVAREVETSSKTITVALVGNPNCGKTSFFNLATGLREKVGNYSGVTVSSKVGTFYHDGYTINLVDLPGTYSLTEYSPEELYVRDFLLNRHPDLVLNIVDAGNLERNMYLTAQLIDMNPRMLMALNMYDELERSGDKLDVESLEKMLGFPVVPVVARTGRGVEDVLEEIVHIYRDEEGYTKHIHINYGENVEDCISSVKKLIDADQSLRDRYHGRYLALELMQGDKVITKSIESVPAFSQIKEAADSARARLEKEYRGDIADIISDIRYGFIRGALRETLTPAKEDKRKLAYALDTVLTNKYLGFPLLVIFLWVMFQTTFTLGAYPQQWLEAGIAALGNWIGGLLPEGMLNDLLVDGIISGVGGVLVFLPNIMIMFMFISFLEDTGYMARAAFIMDKLMHRIGLHGKSFIPYIIGFGCGVPAIMATRTLENPKDRILTILTIPFMSCSARLPVYLLFVAAFFSRNQGLVLMSLYAVGIIFAILTSVILNKTVFKNASDQFVMELPPYRFPTVRNILVHMWDKSVLYLKKMGTVILAASIIIWALGYFPRPKTEMTPAQQSEYSYIGRIGHAIEPVVKPLGFDWRMGVSLATGLAAKEVVVSSLGVLYGAQEVEGEEDTAGLQAKLQSLSNEDGTPFFTPLKAYTFLLFILLYFPCIAAISAIAKEAGRKWAAFSVVYTTCLAWIVSFIFWHVGLLL
ncbi:MAG: ferrous iron transport protein B [Bacteroidales bacterium]|nr:ferrous iron transport protein B [Bacteroidales bacterium]